MPVGSAGKARPARSRPERGDEELLWFSVPGQGADTADKAVGKAITSAKKQGLLVANSVPTGDDPDGAHVETGVIRDVVYVGVFTRYIVDLDAGGELVVARQNEQAPRATHDISGIPARIAWLPEQTIMIPQGEGARS